ncbi:MAG TPA: dockerin type I domain-containing protein [Phycisphaerae bacterium]|nr:dockerin type I domain-containing protein [Phycisphaerae bacterium]
MRVRLDIAVLTLLVFAGAVGRLAAQQFDFAVPSDDQWQYPYNPDPPNRSPGSCFGTVGYDLPPFNYKFNNRDGIVVVAWDTSGTIPTGQGPASYAISAIRVTLTSVPNAQWPADHSVDEWYTYDISGDQLINADGIPRGQPGDTDGESSDTDAGRPIELFGSGFGPVHAYSTWSEFSFYVGSDQFFAAPRDPFPFVYRDGTEELLHVEDSVRGYYNSGLTPPFCGPPDSQCPFTPAPWAIGAPVNYTPGSQPTPFDVTFDVDLGLSDGRVLQYFQEQLDAGRVIVSVTSLRETTQQAGQAGYPSFFMKEATDPGALAPRLTIVLSACALGDGDINCDGSVNDTDAALFVGVLLGTETDSSYVTRSDLNNSNTRDGLDIAPFTQAYLMGP